MQNSYDDGGGDDGKWTIEWVAEWIAWVDSRYTHTQKTVWNCCWCYIATPANRFWFSSILKFTLLPLLWCCAVYIEIRLSVDQRARAWWPHGSMATTVMAAAVERSQFSLLLLPLSCYSHNVYDICARVWVCLFILILCIHLSINWVFYLRGILLWMLLTVRMRRRVEGIEVRESSRERFFFSLILFRFIFLFIFLFFASTTFPTIPFVHCRVVSICCFTVASCSLFEFHFICIMLGPACGITRSFSLFPSLSLRVCVCQFAAHISDFWTDYGNGIFGVLLQSNDISKWKATKWERQGPHNF